MRNPSSSSLAEHAGSARSGLRRRFGEPWPWLLALGPVLVVVASLASAWVAVKSDDGVVAQDYYKQGLLINSRLKLAPPEHDSEAGAHITVTPDGAIRARVRGLPAKAGTLRIHLVRPADPGGEETVVLDRRGDGEYAGALAKQGAGRWILTLQSDRWQLPTTTGIGRIADVRLGADTQHPLK